MTFEGGVLALRSIDRARTGSGRPGSGHGNMSQMKGSLRGPSMKVVTASMRAAQEGEQKGTKDHHVVAITGQGSLTGSMRNKVVPFEVPTPR